MANVPENISEPVIVILNNNYPLEPFLQHEINSGVYKNHQVIIIPLDSCNTSNMSDDSEFQLVDILNPPFVQKYFAWICGIFTAVFSKELWQEIMLLFRQGKFRVMRLAQIVHFAFRTEQKLYLVKKALKKFHLENRKVLFYAYWMTGAAYAAVRLRRMYVNSHCLTRCHRYDIYEYSNQRNYLPFRYLILSGMDRVCPISEDGVRYLNEQYPKKWQRGGVTKFCLGTLDRGLNPYVRENKAYFRIVSCSNLVPVKRVHLLIRALALIQDMKIEWVHYGDGILKSELIHLAESCLPSNIVYHFAGFLKNEELMRRYQNDPVDLFINVSESEGIPVSIMEAMSFGIPVMAPDVGGIGEIVHDRQNGRMLKKDITESELAKNIREFLNLDWDKKIRYRENARQTWENDFSAEKNFHAFYEMILQFSISYEIKCEMGTDIN